MGKQTRDKLVIRGARQHNLRDLDLELPKNSLIVFTGVSGSGKSSLAFDTIYAEGQRRYVESLSAYARQFLKQTPKPDVDSIDGLAPAISIEQKGTGHNPRSTVGTITEIYDYLRVLYAALGTAHCPQCGEEIGAQTREQIIARVLALPRGARIHVLAPLAQERRGEYRDLFDDMRRLGYIRARVDGEYANLSADLELDRYRRHNIEIVVDRGTIGRPGFAPADRTRLAEAVESALELSEGVLLVDWQLARDGGEVLLSSQYACLGCGESFSPPSHASFSFNSPQGMCPTCDGLGTKIEYDPKLLIEHPDKSLLDGAMPTIRGLGNRWRRCQFEGVAKRYGFTLDTPVSKLSEEQLSRLLHGSRGVRIEYHFKDPRGRWEHRWAEPWEGIIPAEMRRYRRIKARGLREKLEARMRQTRCPDCRGGRLKAESLAVTIGGASIADLCAMSVQQASQFFEDLAFTPEEERIAEDALKEIRARLGFLMNVGLHYLAMDRTAPTLAGGESQRIRLASQIGSGLVGVLYVLDEPSIGLHNRDNARLLRTLQSLRDMGNTVLVVEHDEDTMLAADHIVDFGPGAGDHGGEIVASGSLAAVLERRESLTGQYLRRELEIPIPTRRRSSGKVLTVRGARQNNLKDIDVEIPLGIFTCVTGVSGSGKSSLVTDILRDALARDLNRAEAEPGDHDGIDGIEHLDKVIAIDQSPIGRTPRSNPATYINVFDHIRALFAQLPESRVRGYKPGRFSFNVKGGRCEACDGNGSQRLEMDFLADVWVTCEVCEGARFNSETLEVTYKGRSIAQVLDMNVGEAVEFFSALPKIAHMLGTLQDVGMEYVRLGQPAPTLSGGEAQRIKLARELCRKSTGRTLYILDEPTTGLHFADIQKLLGVLHRFAAEGNTVVVVEHNLEVIKTADHLVDLGPEGGEGGGYVVVEGTPEEVARNGDSHTGAALQAFFAERERRSQGRGHSGRLAARSSNGRGKGATPVRRRSRKRLDSLTVRRAREHNLQDVSTRIPRDRFTVFSGVSGSGKSSLALDTIYAEGQRRYIESLSAYARQFLGQMKKPKVDQVAGLSPAICIEQKPASQSPRSTVGTVTEVYDYLRALYARLGEAHCPDCGVEVGTQTSSQIIDAVQARHQGVSALLLAPVVPKGNEEYRDVLERAEQEGFRRVRLDGEVVELGTEVRIDRRRRHRVDLILDRVKVGPRSRSRLADSIEQALDRSGGVLTVQDQDTGEDTTYSRHASCPECDRTFEPMTPRSFSFNHAEGWCPECDGLGVERAADPKAAIPDQRRTLRQGAVATWGALEPENLLTAMLESVARKTGVDLDTPWCDLSTEHRNVILYGTGEQWLRAGSMRVQFKGVFPAFEEATRLSWHYRHRLGRTVRDLPCRACGGARLNPVAAAARLRETTLPELCELPLDEALTFLQGLKLRRRDLDRGGEVLQEAQQRLRFLVDVGLEYVTLGRGAPTLSGGESQRVRLAGQIGSGLTGVLYVLDEPTVGLHPRDNGRLLEALKNLRDLGNTLIAVEHDRDTLEAADHLVDFGPGAGPLGGKIMASGSPQALKRHRKSLTGQYLAGGLAIPVPEDRRLPARPAPRRAKGEEPQPAEGWLTIAGARHNNLRNLSVHLPLGSFICVTGPSGSGKSSLIHDILYNHLAHVFHRARTVPEEHDAILGAEALDKVINVDQSPIGQSPRSNPATYTRVFDHVRELFAMLPEAKVRGYTGLRFSYNHRGGRCEACWGLGSRRIEMHFLPDVWVECEECGGARYNSETLEIRYRGRSIAEVLAMTAAQARDHFANQPKIRRLLQMLVDVGLGYMALGQSAPTLSGGEAQRVKLARELARPGTGRTLYLLDEPTTGLHVADVERLLKVLNRLVEAGNTALVIEHNMEVTKAADWILDLGPGGGEQGGRLVACGPPEKVSQARRSTTAPYLRAALERAPRVPRHELVLVSEEPSTAVKGVEDEALQGEAKPPWERDGRAWHLRERKLQDGRTPDWEGAALEFLVNELMALERMGSVAWNRRDRVTVKPEGKRPAFFMQARTNEYWWFRVQFRTEKGRFDQDDLARKLKLPVWNDIPERQCYGKWSRVRLQARQKRWDHITLFLWSQKELDTPMFRKFLRECYAGYQRVAEA